MAQRSSARSERWERENKAPRLSEQAPALTSLRLELIETMNGRKLLDSECIRHIIVARAAALFEVPCGDARCEDGGHDISREVLIGLRAFKQRFDGTDRCSGYVGDRPCGRLLEYTALAEFDLSRAALSAPEGTNRGR